MSRVRTNVIVLVTKIVSRALWVAWVVGRPPNHRRGPPRRDTGHRAGRICGAADAVPAGTKSTGVEMRVPVPSGGGGRDAEAQAETPALAHVVADPRHHVELRHELRLSLLASFTHIVAVERCAN